MEENKYEMRVLIDALEKTIDSELPKHLKLTKKTENKEILKRCFSDFYNTSYVVCKPYYKPIFMPFLNSYD